MKLSEKQNSMRLAAIEFANGSDIKDVMLKYNVSYASVYNALKKFNIEFNYTYGRKHSIDESFFENIDTEEKAYWLGFIMADGTVIKTNKDSSYNRLKIGLCLKDEDHLIKFKNSIKTTSDIKYYTTKENNSSYSGANYTHCYLNCDSIKLASDLIKHNCIPNKTDFCTIPNIPSELIHHFIRGYFDGDGSISIYTDKNNDKRCEFSITSNSEILLEIQTILIDNCNLNKTKLKTYKRTSKATSLRYGGVQQVKKIFDYLYKDSTIYLDRKYNNFSLLFS